MHGGAIDVESVEGQGATFRVFIPARPEQRTIAPIRIALLDVDGDARSYVAHALRDDGFAVERRAGGEELLRALGDAPFDVALVDADRLGMPAEEFLERANGTPLVRIGLRIPAVLDGWNAILTKPFLMKDLYGAVDSALEHAGGGRGGARSAPAARRSAFARPRLLPLERRPVQPADQVGRIGVSRVGFVQRCGVVAAA